MKGKDPELENEIKELQLKYEEAKTHIYHKKLLGSLKVQDVEEFGNIMNAIGMKHSQNGDHQMAQSWLKKVMKHTQHSIKLKIITLNNLACVYRQSQNLPLALLYIKKAQKQSQKLSHDKISAIMTDCSLNLCAILSSMKEHKKALITVRKALNFLEEAKKTNNIPEEYYSSIYPIVKYNEAVELQNLKQYPEAFECYNQLNEIQDINDNLRQRVKKGKKSMKNLCLKQSLNSSRMRKKSTRVVKNENVFEQVYGQIKRLPQIRSRGKISHREKPFASVRKFGEIQNINELMEPSKRNRF